jgi:hypothetical protein
VLGLKRTFRGWLQSHNDELSNLYSSLDIIRLSNQEEQDELDGYVACMGTKKICTQFSGKPVGKSNLEDVGVDGGL